MVSTVSLDHRAGEAQAQPEHSLSTAQAQPKHKELGARQGGAPVLNTSKRHLGAILDDGELLSRTLLSRGMTPV